MSESGRLKPRSGAAPRLVDDLFVRGITVKKRPKIDMSATAVTARLRRACGLGDAERLATMIRSAVAEIRGEKATSEIRCWQLKQSAKRGE